jgi:hypothetical protein
MDIVERGGSATGSADTAGLTNHGSRSRVMCDVSWTLDAFCESDSCISISASAGGGRAMTMR